MRHGTGAGKWRRPDAGPIISSGKALGSQRAAGADEHPFSDADESFPLKDSNRQPESRPTEYRAEGDHMFKAICLLEENQTNERSQSINDE